MASLFYEREIGVGETHFHINGSARRLVLKQRQKETRKWSIPTGNVILSGERFYLELNFSTRTNDKKLIYHRDG